MSQCNQECHWGLGPGISGSLKIGREGKDLQNALAGCTHSTCAPSFLWVTSYFTSVQIRMVNLFPGMKSIF